MDIKKILATITLCFVTLTISAQVEKQQTLDANIENVNEGNTSYVIEPAEFSDLAPSAGVENMRSDSIRTSFSLPYYSVHRPLLFTSWMPTSPFGWGMPWDMHEGFNAQLGLGVMVGFGKNNPFKGASFFTDLSLSYVKPLSNRWTLALGGTLSMFKFFNNNVFAGSAFAIANYKFDEHWSASIYASYNHMPEGFGMYNFSTFSDKCARIGGEVTYKFNEKFAVSVGLSHEIPVGNETRPWQPMYNPDKDRNNNRNALLR